MEIVLTERFIHYIVIYAVVSICDIEHICIF